MSIKVLTLNIEGNKHIDRVIDFLNNASADVICLQEVFEEDVSMITQSLGMQCVFTINLYRKDFDENRNIYHGEGIAILSRLPVELEGSEFYYHPGIIPSKFINDTEEHVRQTEGRSVVWMTVKDLAGETHTILNTHFTWTQNGLPNAYQNEDMKNLLAFTSQFSDYILCGDFNIPRRSNGLYQEILSHNLIDHIPQSIESSIDLGIHRKGNDPIIRPILSTTMVDYIFSTPDYMSSEFIQHSGMSDHTAMSVLVTKNKN